MKPSTVTRGVKQGVLESVRAPACLCTGGQFDLKLIRVFLLMWPESLLQSPLKTACLPACTWVHLSVTGKINNAAQLSPWLFLPMAKTCPNFTQLKRLSYIQTFTATDKITFQQTNVCLCTAR